MVKFIMYILPQLFFLKKQAWYHPTSEILMQAMLGVGWAWGFWGLAGDSHAARLRPLSLPASSTLSPSPLSPHEGLSSKGLNCLSRCHLLCVPASDAALGILSVL